MIEVARILSARPQKLPCRVVFVAFSAEERGLIGSFYYINHPPVPLDSTVAMVNLDMVGRPNDSTLATAGTGNSPQLAELVDRIGREHGFSMLETPGGFTGSDHLPFSGRGIPAVHLITTGGFDDYHRPSDDADKLDAAWMGRVASMTADLVVAVAECLSDPNSSPSVGPIPPFAVPCDSGATSAPRSWCHPRRRSRPGKASNSAPANQDGAAGSGRARRTSRPWHPSGS